MTLGFIGQGFVGKAYADYFEGKYPLVRYSLEEPYKQNKDAIASCDIVFVAVPTPTKSDKEGMHFDDSIVRETIVLTKPGAIVVIKSTILPGTTESIQAQYPDRTILFSPEFLSKNTAAHDTEYPFSNILGVPVEDEEHRMAAQQVLKLLPEAPVSKVMSSKEAEIVKYAHNVNGYVQIVLFNIMYDLAHSFGYDWEDINEALQADPYIAHYYTNPVHKGGRGAGGICFIKDYAAFRLFYEKQVSDPSGIAALHAIEQKNIALLNASGKDQTFLKEVYGDTSPTS